MPDWIDNVARQHLSKDYAKVDLAQNLANKSAKTIKHYVASVPYFQRVDAIISLRKYLDILIFFSEILLSRRKSDYLHLDKSWGF